MKVVFAILGVLAAIAIAVSLAWFYLVWSLRGGGEVVTEERALPSFNRIVIEGFADVTLVQGDTESVQIEAPQKQLPGVRTQVSGGTLTIAHGGTRSWLSSFFGGGGRGARVRSPFAASTRSARPERSRSAPRRSGPTGSKCPRPARLRCESTISTPRSSR